MSDKPEVGQIVHLLRGGVCYAAVITEVSENGIGLHPFRRPDGSGPGDDWHPYNSLHSARPTSGWHWPIEHSEPQRAE